MIEYIEEIKEKMKSQLLAGNNLEREDIAKKVHAHANEMLDLLMVDEFFDNFMDNNIKFQDQKYFE